MINPNPFTFRAMIKDPSAFVGRAEILNDVFTMLGSMQNLSIVGPRRIGKSSLLYYITQPAGFITHLRDSEPYVFVFLDLQEFAALGPEDFFATAVERVQRAAGGRITADVARDGTAAGFRRFLARAGDAGLRLVLCCDEFEVLADNQHFGADFFSYLRGLCSNYSLSLVTSSRASLYDLCHRGELQSSQFWNVFVERALGLMPPDEARALAAAPWAPGTEPFDPADVDWALDLTGGHPMFMHIACYQLFAARRGGAPRDRDALLARFLEEARRHYAYAWEQLSGEEKGALLALARGAAPLDEACFASLQRQALAAGSAAQALAAGAGLCAFLREQAGPAAPEPRAAQAAAAPTAAAQAPAAVPQPAEAAQPAAGSSYADFELRLDLLEGNRCRVLVLDSLAGQDSMECTLPFSMEELSGVMVDLGRMVARGSAAPPAPAAPAAALIPALMPAPTLTPAGVGEALFRTVFAGAVGQLFFESWGEARSRGQGLRIKIHVDPEHSPELAALPWEFLFNDRRRAFLGLSRLTPIVRYLDVQAPTAPARVRPPLRVLVVIAAPSDLPPLDAAREQAMIRAAWGGRKDVSVSFLDPATPSALQAQLWQWRPHVLHFIGHGDFDRARGVGRLQFVDEQGSARPLSGPQLGALLANTPSVRLAFLNACSSAEHSRLAAFDPYSGVAAALVLAGLPAVVAMQFPISDRAALAFANGFYPVLASGEPVDAAAAFGREAVALELADSLEWGTPCLFMRVADGRLFEIEAA